MCQILIDSSPLFPPPPPGEPAPRHEEGRHPDAQPQGVQQEQEEQEGCRVRALLRPGAAAAAAAGRSRRRLLLPESRDSAGLWPLASPAPHGFAPAPLPLPAVLHPPPGRRHGAHAGVMLVEETLGSNLM